MEANVVTRTYTSLTDSIDFVSPIYINPASGSKTVLSAVIPIRAKISATSGLQYTNAYILVPYSKLSLYEGTLKSNLATNLCSIDDNGIIQSKVAWNNRTIGLVVCGTSIVPQVNVNSGLSNDLTTYKFNWVFDENEDFEVIDSYLSLAPFFSMEIIAQSLTYYIAVDCEPRQRNGTVEISVPYGLSGMTVTIKQIYLGFQAKALYSQTATGTTPSGGGTITLSTTSS